MRLCSVHREIHGSDADAAPMLELRLRVAAPTPEGVCSTALPAGRGEERRPPSSSRSVGLSSGISFPSISHCHPASTTYQWAPVYAQQCLSVPARPVGPCAVCRARCRSSSEVNVPVHDLQAVAVLRLRATVLAIFTRNTLAHPPLPRVHRAAPRPHRPIEHTARHDRNEARQPCPTPDSTPWHAAHATTPTRKKFQSPSRQRARGDPFDAPEPEESDSPLLPNLNACAHTALTTGVCRP